MNQKKPKRNEHRWYIWKFKKKTKDFDWILHNASGDFVALSKIIFSKYLLKSLFCQCFRFFFVYFSLYLLLCSLAFMRANCVSSEINKNRTITILHILIWLNLNNADDIVQLRRQSELMPWQTYIRIRTMTDTHAHIYFAFYSVAWEQHGWDQILNENHFISKKQYVSQTEWSDIVHRRECCKKRMKSKMKGAC